MKLFLFALLLITINVFGQPKLKSYELKVSFAPSFMYGCVVKIKVDHNLATIQLQSKQLKAEVGFTDSVTTKTSILKYLSRFLKDSLSNIDTLKYRKFFLNGDSVKIPDFKTGLDGIIVYGDLSSNTYHREFKFWSPEKNSGNAQLVKNILAVLNKAFNHAGTTNYLEQLEQYFPHQLGLKNLSKNPLRYKLFGNISSNEENQLEAFFKSLPKHKRTEIDMSNYTGMGTMFYSIIEEYIFNNKNIYWYKPTSKGLIDLYKIGVHEDHIISEKKVSKIETKDGKEIITTVDY